MTYSERLKSPQWQKRRLKVMEYAHWRCQICGAKDRTLHCHHSYYTKGKAPWQYPDGAIICVCEVCHEKLHPEKRRPAATPTTPAILVESRGMEALPQPDAKGYAATPSELAAKEKFARLRKMLEATGGGNS